MLLLLFSTYICCVKHFQKQLGSFLLLLAFLATSIPVFATEDGATASVLQEKVTLQKASGISSIFVEEASVLEGFSSVTNHFSAGIPFYSASSYSLFVPKDPNLLFGSSQFFPNKRKLLTQQIFPYHFFW